MLSRFLAVIIALVFLVPTVAFADKSNGQTVYVPCYSDIHHGIKTRRFNLTVTLSIRNVDLKKNIKILSVDYYNTEGEILKKYVTEPIEMGPLDTKEFVVQELEHEGGSGANFIVRWESKGAVNIPIMEAIMIGTGSHQGISFTSRGKEIER